MEVLSAEERPTLSCSTQPLNLHNDKPSASLLPPNTPLSPSHRILKFKWKQNESFAL